MVNASVNWASYFGATLALVAFLSIPTTIANLFFILTRRTDNTIGIILLCLYKLFTGLLRTFGCVAAGLILFFQGWRLDPILQMGQMLMVSLLIIEIGGSLISDVISWIESNRRPYY